MEKSSRRKREMKMMVRKPKLAKIALRTRKRRLELVVMKKKTLLAKPSKKCLAKVTPIECSKKTKKSLRAR